MSIKAVNWALNDVRCQPDFKVILIAMGERADDNGFCFPTQAELSHKTDIPLRTLKRKVQQLVDLGVMTKVTKRVEQNLRRNSYRLHLHKDFNLLGMRTAPKKNNGANVAPLSEEAKTQDSATVAPKIVPPRHQSDEEWCHPDGTQNGATHVAYKPPLNHQYSNNTACTTTETDRLFETNQPISTRTRITMSPDWQPSDHVFEKLDFERKIPREFAEQQLAGFVLYHDKTSNRHGAFDSKFHAHVIHNWESSKTIERPIAADWLPDQVTVKRIRQAGVPSDFIQERVIEFVMFWRESGRPGIGWNAKFYDAVLRAWNRVQPAGSGARTAGAIAAQQSTDQSMSNLVSRLTDRSWAEG